MDITVNGERENKTYTFAINTATIDGDMDADTSKWTFTLGDEVRSYDEYYGRNLQDYAYDKTGITESMFAPFIDYFGKSFLYDMVNHEGGLEGCIRVKMELGEDQTLGDWALSTLVSQLGKLSNITKEFPFSFMGTFTLKTGEVQNIPEATVTDAELAETLPTLELSLDYGDNHEEGQIGLDLSYLRTAVGEFIGKLQQNLSTGDWLKNNYAASPLLSDITNLVSSGLTSVLSKPIEGADQDYSTPFEMINDAWQADAWGDEGLADEATRECWKKEQELLKSEGLANDLIDGLVKQVVRIPGEYEAIDELLKSQCLVAEGKESLFKVDLKEGATYLGLIANSALGLDRIDTLGSLIQSKRRRASL